jgi:hypothetical protein
MSRRESGGSSKASPKNLKEFETAPKEFKWMGFKSHMMATMAKWREINYLTDTVFHCVSYITAFCH